MALQISGEQSKKFKIATRKQKGHFEPFRDFTSKVTVIGMGDNDGHLYETK